MNHDVELMRDLLFLLETRQTSPRTSIVLSIEEEAETLGELPETVEAGLNVLLDLDYIDGPGQDEPGYWFFRKLTRKGTEFVRATRSPKDWEKMKRHYATRSASLRG